MAYGDDINALGPSHRYPLDGNANDATSSNNGTNSGGVFTGPALCEDVTNSWETNSTADRITLPGSANINTSAQSRKAVGGWFQATAIQNPPKVIYCEGDATTQSFKILLGWGNNLMFETDDPAFLLQVFGDTPLVAGRNYHLFAVFEGNGFANEFRCYLDGVKQLNAEPLDRQPDAATLSARTAAVFGVPAAGARVGGVPVTQLSPINGRYNQWTHFTSANAVLTDTEIREELFEKGALPDVTITNQAGLDALASTLRPNVTCCIRVDVAGDISLDADNVTFDPLASIHVQYTGSGTLTWTNSNGSNASIGSTTGGGTINFINPAVLTLTGIPVGAEVRLYDNENLTDNSWNTELAGVESNVGTTFIYNHGGAVNNIIVQVQAAGFEELEQEITLTAVDQTIALLLVAEENA